MPKSTKAPKKKEPAPAPKVEDEDLLEDIEDQSIDDQPAMSPDEPD
jgi:hypothetical protein